MDLDSLRGDYVLSDSVRGITEISAETGREIRASHQIFIEGCIQTSELTPDLNAASQYFQIHSKVRPSSGISQLC